ncbi:hypothetical protein FQN54_003326 [Arachnomyces sp. PD_36]|nr:hypothetical protein FQN54_003326 [Arachnomyces sp. PD_36]
MMRRATLTPRNVFSRLTDASLPPARNGACIFCQPRLKHRSNAIVPLRSPHSSRFASTNASPASPKQQREESEHSSPSTASPDISTHYTIFPKTIPSGPPPSSPFAISPSELRREFLALQSLAHPDKFSPGIEKQRAEALSSRINEAYRTLLDPLLRAQYLLLEKHGIDVTAEDGAAKKENQDNETLMEVMEVQEAIEEAENEATIGELKVENEARVEECVKSLGEAFDRGDIDAARRECIRLRFWYSVREGLREWEPGNRNVRLVH